MRAMEYRDLYGPPVIFRGLQDVIGQFPFDASLRVRVSRIFLQKPREPSVFDWTKHFTPS